MVTDFPQNFFRIDVTEAFFISSKKQMSAYQEPTFIQRIMNGDTKAFEVLVDRYKNMVFSLALRMLKNREEAEEVSQDTFVKVYKSLGKFKGDSKFATWVYRIAYNSCLDRIKTYKQRDKLVVFDEFTQNQIISLENALDNMARADCEKSVKACMHELSADDCALITMFYYEELSLEEIAKIIDVKQNNVKIKLFRARKRLATIMRRYLQPEILENYE